MEPMRKMEMIMMNNHKLHFNPPHSDLSLFSESIILHWCAQIMGGLEPLKYYTYIYICIYIYICAQIFEMKWHQTPLLRFLGHFSFRALTHKT